MNNLSIEKSLIHFANVSISDHLASKSYSALFKVTTDRIKTLDDEVGDYVLSTKEAQKLRFNPPESLDSTHITGELRKPTKAALGEIAIEIINIAANTSRKQQDIHKSIQYITKCLWPLYSRDIDTNMLGFDLQEHSDFFEDYSEQDRIHLKDKLIREWKEDGYIAE